MYQARIISILLICFLCTKQHAQRAAQPISGNLNSQNDSLSGFDEGEATRAAISENFTGKELAVRLQQLKRRFVFEKYYLQTNTAAPIIHRSSSNPTNLLPACLNADFEASGPTTVTANNQVPGWLLEGGITGINPNSTSDNCNLLGCCPGTATESVVFNEPSGYIDPVIGIVYPIYSVFGSSIPAVNTSAANPQLNQPMRGSNFIRINSPLNNCGVERLEKTFVVNTANSLFQYAFISVVYPGHSCCDAAAFRINVRNVNTNSTITCNTSSLSAPTAACNSFNTINYLVAQSGLPSTSLTTSPVFNRWEVRSINLLPYLGDTIQIQVIATDCTAGGHYGYAYFDAQCVSAEVSVNNSSYLLGATINEFQCDTNGTTLCGSPQLGPYVWAGPGLGNNSPYTVASYSNQCFSPTGAGSYTLSMLPAGSCSSLTQVFNVQLASPVATVQVSDSTICIGESVQLNAVNFSNCLWNTNDTTSVISVTPAATTLYTLSGTDVNGCAASASISVAVDLCTQLSTQTTQPTLSLSPNPGSGKFTLSLYGARPNSYIVIVNQLGQQVHAQTLREGENTLELNSLSDGLYYYTLQSQGRKLQEGKLQLMK